MINYIRSGCIAFFIFASNFAYSQAAVIDTTDIDATIAAGKDVVLAIGSAMLLIAFAIFIMKMIKGSGR
jgi:hypothetical protein